MFLKYKQRDAIDRTVFGRGKTKGTKGERSERKKGTHDMKWGKTK